jgi:predicted dehydrogenase
MMNEKVRVGLVGSGFITSIHADALRRCAGAEIVAVASPTRGKAAAFARRHGIPRHFTDYRKLLELDEVDLVVVGVPNDLHCEVTLNAAGAGKHIVLEKPMCLNLAEADRMSA